MSVERSSSSGNDLSLRLELANERQRRSLAEDRVKHFEDKWTMQQSSVSLINKAIAERNQLDGECGELRGLLDRTRSDNQELAGIVQQLDAQRAALETRVGEVSHERDQYKLECAKLRSELSLAHSNSERLESTIADRAKDKDTLVQALAKKDQSLSELQEHFKAITDRVRSYSDEVSSLTLARNDAENAAANAMQRVKTVQNEQETIQLTHVETVTRLTLLLRHCEAMSDMYRTNWLHCTQYLLPQCESQRRSVLDDAAQLTRELRLTSTELEQLRSKCQKEALERRLAGVARSVMTDESSSYLQTVFDQREQLMEALRAATMAKTELQQDVTRLQKDLERHQILLDKWYRQTRDQTGSPPSSPFARSAEGSTSPLTRRSEPRPTVSNRQNSFHNDPNTIVTNEELADGNQQLKAWYHHGESLVLRQQMDVVAQRMLHQTAVFEETLKQNDLLKEELLALNRENKLLESQYRELEYAVNANNGKNSLSRSNQNHHDGEGDEEVSRLSNRLIRLQDDLKDAAKRSAALKGELEAKSQEAKVLRDELHSAKQEAESYQKSMQQLHEHVKSLQADRIPKAIHIQEMQYLETRVGELTSRLEFVERQVQSERQRRESAEAEAARLRDQQELDSLREECERVTGERDALLKCVDDVRQDAARSAAIQLQERDYLLADAARNIIRASEEMEQLEREKSSLKNECDQLMSRIDALLSLPHQPHAGTPSTGYHTPRQTNGYR